MPGTDDEVSVYAIEAYYTGPASRVRRFTYRRDGYASLHAGSEGGEIVTRPLTFDGKSLVLNAKVESNGEVQVEIQDEAGKPVVGFEASECQPFSGDSTRAVVGWTGKPDLGAVAGRPIRLRFTLKNADLFSFRFE